MYYESKIFFSGYDSTGNIPFAREREDKKLAQKQKRQKILRNEDILSDFRTKLFTYCVNLKSIATLCMGYEYTPPI